jgi:hypothetical protein
MFCYSGLLLAFIVAHPLPATSPKQVAVPDVPKDIAVPPGYRCFLKLNARGVQIYQAVARSGKLEWALEAPLAELVDAMGAKAGCHYEGPSWEAADGSKVVRDKAAEVKSAPAPNPKDIPWLLLKVKAEDGPNGAFSPAVYIQRLETVGGKAPAELPRRVGTKVGVPYKAVYYFYAAAKP